MTEHATQETFDIAFPGRYWHRLEDGRLAEHWDAIQPIDTVTRLLFFLIGGSIQNNNSTF